MACLFVMYEGPGNAKACSSLLALPLVLKAHWQQVASSTQRILLSQLNSHLFSHQPTAHRAVPGKG
jgi:hypothetical protein